MKSSLQQRLLFKAKQVKDCLNLYAKANQKIRKSNWYYNQFPHLREYERLQREADIICIGSTPAKYAIDFKDVSHVKGYNLAICPETIFYDFQVLKNYHSYLREGGIILFVLCPFTFLKDYYRNENGSTSYLNIRYYPVLHRAMIDTFDLRLYHKWVENPILIGKEAWKRLIKDVPNSKTYSLQSNPDSPEVSKEFCRKRLLGWMNEFKLSSLTPDNIPAEIENAIRGNVKIYQEMKFFIEERGYKGLIIIPPFPEEMTSLLPQDLVEHTLLEPVKDTGFPFISYFGHKEWLSRDLYFHGFLLNAKGRELLTKDILAKINYK